MAASRSRGPLVWVLLISAGLLGLVLWRAGAGPGPAAETATPPAVAAAGGEETVPLPGPLPPAGRGAQEAVRTALEAVSEPAEVVPPGGTATSEESDPHRLVVIGRTVDEFGEPIAGVQVRGFLAREPVFSDGEGRFRWSVFLASAQGLPALSLRFEHADHRGASAQVPAAGGFLDVGEVVLTRGGVLRGWVHDTAGLPVADAEVVAHRVPLRGNPARFGISVTDTLASARSGEDGSFRIVGVPPGSGGLAARGPEHGWTFGPGYELEANGERAGFRLELEPLDDEHFIEILLVDESGEPVPNLRLQTSYRSGAGSGSSQAMSDEAGRVRQRFEHLPASADFVYNDLFGSYGFAALRDVPGGSRDRVLRLRRAEKVELLLRTPAGEPIETTVSVERRHVQESERIARFLWRREFEGGRVALVPLDTPYEVALAATGYREKVVGPLGPGADPARVEVVLDPLPTLAGRVFAAGDPLEGAEVQLLRAVGAGSSVDGMAARTVPQALSRTRTDGRGAFVLPLIEDVDRFYVRATHARLAPGDVGPLEWREGDEALPPVELHLSEGGELFGTVRLHGTEPVVGATVVVSRGDGFPRHANTDSRGDYRLEGLTAGRYLVEVRRAGTLLAVPLANPEAATGAEEPWSVDIPEGRRVRLDPDLSKESEVVALVRLAFDERPTRGWQALLMDPNGQRTWDRSEPAAGALRLGTWRAGTYQIELRGPNGERFRRTVELGVGTREFELTFATGRLARALGPLAPGLPVRWESADGWHYRADLRPGSEQIAPAGRLRIGSGGDMEFVELAAGQRLELP